MVGDTQRVMQQKSQGSEYFFGGDPIGLPKRDGYKFSSHSQIQTWMKPTEHVYIRLYKKSFIGKGKLFHVHWFISLPSSLYLFGT